MNKQQKKISFFSAILLVVGSSIGAGIFLKNQEILDNSFGSIIMVLISWALSIIAVICMGISLIEIAGASKNNNLGIVEWVKDFGNKFFFHAAKFFMAFIYLPINFFIMPYYVVQTIQDAFGWNNTPWWISFLIAFAIAIWFLVISGYSAKATNIQNWIITSVKFIPIVFAILIGFILIASGHGGNGNRTPSWLPQQGWNETKHNLLTRLIPWLGIIGSLPSIIFSFDGFYSAAGIQTEMQKPEKTGLALVSGLVIVSVIDVLITISLLLCSDGRVVGISFIKNNYQWINTVINILIAFGILGIINGFSAYNPRYYEGLIGINGLYCPKQFKHKLNHAKPVVGIIYSLIICGGIFILGTIIGCFGFMDASGYGEAYGNDLAKLYSFCDLMANWTSILVFGLIVIAMIGGLVNRKTNKIKTNHVRGFKTCTIISASIILLSIAYLVVSVFVNIAIIASWKNDIGLDIGTIAKHHIYTELEWINDITAAIVSLGVLIVFICGSMLPAWIITRKENKRINV